MKPSVDEQLRQSRRILLEQVLPALESDHVADVVRRLAADLRKLGTCWEAAAPFSRWEVDILEALLDALAPALGIGAGRQLAAMRGAPVGAGASYPELCARTEVLRLALDHVVRHLPPPAKAPVEWEAVRNYCTERLARDPMNNRQPHA